MNYATNFVTEELCNVAEKETKNQSVSILWYDLRYARITASKFYEAANCRTVYGSSVKKILEVSKKYENIFMKRGRVLEKSVLKVVEKKTNVKICDCGFIIMHKLPFMGASPDAILLNMLLKLVPHWRSILFKIF